MYKISQEALREINSKGPEFAVLMETCLKRYFTTGKEPKFNTEELRDYWFYLKTHELADAIQKHGEYAGAWWNTFDHIELKSDLNINASKFGNPRFKVGGYHNGPSEG